MFDSNERYCLLSSNNVVCLQLLSNAGNLVSANKLVGLFGLHSTSTMLEYRSYFKDAYLIGQVPQFSNSMKAQARNPKKYMPWIGV